jgi:alpha-tubulin suppressor-like RCC1 family protein
MSDDESESDEFESVFNRIGQSIKKSKMDWGFENFSREFFRYQRKHSESVYSIFSSWWSEHAFWINNRSRLWGFGIKDSGQLGPEYMENEGRYIRPSVFRFFEDKGRIVKICCGEKHSVFLVEDFETGKRKVYSCGNNVDGQLGYHPKEGEPYNINIIPEVTDEQEKLYSIIPKPYEKDVIEIDDIFTGANHTVLLAKKEGSVYVSGSNEYGQIGLIKETKSQFVPTILRFPFTEPIIYVSCGENQTFFMTSKGHVVAVGDNRYGQLGVFSKEKFVYYPEDVWISKEHKIFQISCGSKKTVFLTSEKKVYISGERFWASVRGLNGADRIQCGKNVILAFFGDKNEVVRLGIDRDICFYKSKKSIEYVFDFINPFQSPTYREAYETKHELGTKLKSTRGDSIIFILMTKYILLIFESDGSIYYKGSRSIADYRHTSCIIEKRFLFQTLS